MDSQRMSVALTSALLWNKANDLFITSLKCIFNMIQAAVGEYFMPYFY